MDALIGYTGFVGGNLAQQRAFDHEFNSANIEDISKQEYDLVVCAGVPGTKWLANKHPQEDMAKISRLLQNLVQVKCRKLLLISTVDVYHQPQNADETTPLVLEGLHPYGRNRIIVEQFVQERFPDCNIIRLPAIFGPGLKKNFVFDLLNNHCLHWTHRDSVFQFYYLKRLWQDILTVMDQDIKLINFSSQPVGARELARDCFNLEFENKTERPPHIYDVKTKYAKVFGGSEGYMYSRDQVRADIREFIRQEDHNEKI